MDAIHMNHRGRSQPNPCQEKEIGIGHPVEEVLEKVHGGGVLL
jgi:hypothetical protein